MSIDDVEIKISIDADPKKLKYLLDNISTTKEFLNLISSNYKSNNFICKTIVCKQEIPVGLIVIIGEDNSNLSKFTGFDEFLIQIATAYESAIMFTKINEMAIRDGLTNLYNHKHFMEELEKEIKKSIRYKYPISLLFFDIDEFKKFNDQNGHQIGDEVLVKVSKILMNKSRIMDIVGIKNFALTSPKDKNELFASRYGGEEFAIILPHTDINGAHIAGERFRLTIEEADFPCQEKQPNGTLTISMGIAQVSETINSSKLLILVADAALYKAKKNGRNQVQIADAKLIESVISKGKLEL